LPLAHFDVTVRPFARKHCLAPVNASRTSVQPNPTAALLRAGTRLSCAALAHRLRGVSACETDPATVCS